MGMFFFNKGCCYKIKILFGPLDEWTHLVCNEAGVEMIKFGGLILLLHKCNEKAINTPGHERWENQDPER